MKLREVPGYVRDTVLRLLPHATRPGLRSIGHPGRNAPVLLTGNFTLTVRRVLRVLEGRDAWLLVANSRGINVWCAAGGGHLTEHDVISVVRASGVGDRVDHRDLVLPQLAATGIGRQRIRDAIGWEPRWGPARLEDLPEYLDRGGHIQARHRKMRFPFWERMEMAAMWGVPLAGLALGVVWALLGLTVGAVVALSVLSAIVGEFALLPVTSIKGWRAPPTHAAFAAAGLALGTSVLVAVDLATPGALVATAIACAAAMALLSIDIAGTTPWYPSSINSLANHFDIELVTERCTGTAECVLVCPRDVLRMQGSEHKVAIVRPDDCVRCGACIVQCPEDALRFVYPDGRTVEANVVRTTRVNLLGRRAAPAPTPDRGASS